MKAPKILNYITPQIVKYQNIDDLLENNRQRTFFDVAENLSIDKLLEEYFVCVVGEPGIGKSRLVDEIKKRISFNFIQSIYYTIFLLGWDIRGVKF